MKPLHELKQVAFTNVTCVGEIMAMVSTLSMSPFLSWGTCDNEIDKIIKDSELYSRWRLKC